MWLIRKIRSLWQIVSTGRTSLNLGRKNPVAISRMIPEMRKITGRINAGFQVQNPKE
jgi:hypothetical protein